MRLSASSIALVIMTVLVSGASSKTYYKICNKNSGKCLTPKGSSTGTVDLVQQPYNAADTQLWDVTASPDGNYLNFKSLATKSTKCVGLSGGSQEAITPAIQAPCDKKPNQDWNFSGDDYNSLTLLSRGSNFKYCLGVSGASKSNGAAVEQFKCDGKVNQKWAFTKVEVTNA